MISTCVGHKGLVPAGRAKIELARLSAGWSAEQRFWLSKGIHAVPSFILDGRYLIPGAQDPEVFVAAVRRLLDEKAA